MGIEPTYPAWKAGILTVVLHLLVKYTRTDRTRTGTDCRIKTFRSTVLLLQGTHPFPLLIQFVARVYQFPLTVLVYLCCWLDSNQRPSVYQTDALKTNWATATFWLMTSFTIFKIHRIWTICSPVNEVEIFHQFCHNVFNLKFVPSWVLPLNLSVTYPMISSDIFRFNSGFHRHSLFLKGPQALRPMSWGSRR